MKTSAPILVTGATGFVGSHFLYRYLRAGGAAVAVVRGATVDVARARLLATLADVAASYDQAPLEADACARTSVVLGDVTRAELGIERSALEPLRGRVSAIWHFAASLAYQDEAEHEITAHNIDGVLNALATARLLGVGRFLHVSTAYTAGRLSGSIPEELHPEETPVNNHYEKTKGQAERLVVEACASGGMDYRIFRPSIVIGPSTTKRMGGSTTGLYGFLRELRRGQQLLNIGDAVHTVAGDPDVELNVIPVDHVVEPMLRLDDPGFSTSRVLHLTNPRAPRLGDAMTLACDLAGVRPLRLVPGYRPQTLLEHELGKRMEFYSYYFREPKVFARSIEATLDLSTAVALRPYLEHALVAPTATKGASAGSAQGRVAGVRG